MTDTAKPTPEEEEDEFEFEYDCEVKILGQTYRCQTGSLNWQIANKIDALEERVRDLEAARDALEFQLRDLLTAVKWKSPPVDFGTWDGSGDTNYCWEARVPVAFVDNAEAALAKHGKEV